MSGHISTGEIQTAIKMMPINEAIDGECKRQDIFVCRDFLIQICKRQEIQVSQSQPITKIRRKC